MNEAFLEFGVEVFAFYQAGGKFCGVHGGIPLADYNLWMGVC
jgi:hypothetical protein